MTGRAAALLAAAGVALALLGAAPASAAHSADFACSPSCEVTTENQGDVHGEDGRRRIEAVSARTRSR